MGHDWSRRKLHIFNRLIVCIYALPRTALVSSSARGYKKLLTELREYRLRINRHVQRCRCKERAIASRESWRHGTDAATNLIADCARSIGPGTIFCKSNGAAQTEGEPLLQAAVYTSCTYIRRRARLTLHAWERHTLKSGHLVSFGSRLSSKNVFAPCPLFQIA